MTTTKTTLEAHKVAHRMFTMHNDLVLGIIRKRIRKTLAHRGVTLSASAVEDMHDDAYGKTWVCFTKLLEKGEYAPP